MNRKMQTAIDQAIGNPVLGNALTRFREAYVVSRAKAYEGIDFTALKEQIAAARTTSPKSPKRSRRRRKHAGPRSSSRGVRRKPGTTSPPWPATEA